MIHSVDLPDDVTSIMVLCRLLNGGLMICSPTKDPEAIRDATEMVIDAADLLTVPEANEAPE